MIVITVFRSACQSCHNLVGFNFKFGQDYVRNCDDVCVGLANLVREIRDNLYTRDFDLNVIVRDVTTSHVVLIVFIFSSVLVFLFVVAVSPALWGDL